ncbi:MAG: hypothetical protein AAFQ80_12235 [Cyanobacteria bacterium J06621_8]
MTNYDVPINNSAGRLVFLLKKAIENGSKTKDKLYISAICEALGLTNNPTNRAESFSKLFYLIHQLEIDLSLLSPTKIKNHKETITQLKQIISCGFTNKFATTQHLNNDKSYIIRDLENCADSLSDVIDLKVVEEEELVKLVGEIDGLYQTINSSDIGKDLKFLLLKKLTALKEVLENYQFQGSDGIKREIENIMGSIAINNDKVRTDEEKGLVMKVFELLRTLITTASAAKNLLPENIVEIGQNFLPPS